MNDPRTTARTAREQLAQGLNMLQTPGLPPDFLSAAEPIARAMGALMQAERSDGSVAGIRPQAEVALASLREALGKLQAIPSGHPTAEQAMGTIAGSLGLVHGLSRLEAAPVPQATQGSMAGPSIQETMAVASPGAFAPQAFQPPAQPQFQPPPQAQFQPPPQAQFQPPPQAQFQPPPQAQFQPPAQPQFQPPAQPFQPPAHAMAPPPAGPAGGPAGGGVFSPSKAPSGAAEGDAPPGAIEASLGAHSPSNFYKTLNGNDIVEHGGIFVSTYAIPRLEQQLLLRVHLPGGYHFDCTAIVRWTREQRDNPDAPPGFGAQMVGVTAEQRQLIMRYVRNREPMFYDDF